MTSREQAALANLGLQLAELRREVELMMWMLNDIRPGVIHVNASVAARRIPHMAALDCGCELP